MLFETIIFKILVLAHTFIMTQFMYFKNIYEKKCFLILHMSYKLGLKIQNFKRKIFFQNETSKLFVMTQEHFEQKFGDLGVTGVNLKI